MNRLQVVALTSCVLFAVQSSFAHQKSNGSLVIPPKNYTPQKATASSEKGRKLFEQQKCSVCHSIKSKGGCLAPPFDGIGSRRSREFIMSRFTAGKAQTDKFDTLYGGPELMPHLRIPSNQSTLITDYLLTLPEPPSGFKITAHQKTAMVDKGKSSASKEPTKETNAPSIERGKKLFFKDGGCAACHSIGSLGGQFGPKLDSIGSRMTKEAIREQMTNADLFKLYAPSEYNERGTVMPPMSLSEAEKEDLATFLKSLD
ncbi:MAG: cytochrome c [Cyanobacteria bacterium]|nr:cytochrome c [Cyanobacteriota bacterium]